MQYGGLESVQRLFILNPARGQTARVLENCGLTLPRICQQLGLGHRGNISRAVRAFDLPDPKEDRLKAKMLQCKDPFTFI
jgi:hypothetical protein